MNEELKKALELIKNECEKHKNCENCPFDLRNINYTFCDEMFRQLPFQWKLD